MHSDNLIDWLTMHLSKLDQSLSENYLLTSELLSLIILNCSEDYQIKFCVTLNGLETLLQLLNGFRREEIQTEEQHEALVNVFNVISATMLHQDNVSMFVKVQGIQLMLSLYTK